MSTKFYFKCSHCIIQNDRINKIKTFQSNSFFRIEYNYFKEAVYNLNIKKDDMFL
jgi:hypothetical protein